MSRSPLRRIPNRLGALTLNRGGITAEQALSRAEVAMETLRPALLADLDQLLTEMEQAFGPAASDRDRREPGTLYALSSRIMDVAGALPDSQIDRAAFSLCDLAERCGGESAWNWPAVEVHLSALRLLRREGQRMTAVQKATLLGGLRTLAGATRAPPSPA